MGETPENNNVIIDNIEGKKNDNLQTETEKPNNQQEIKSLSGKINQIGKLLGDENKDDFVRIANQQLQKSEQLQDKVKFDKDNGNKLVIKIDDTDFQGTLGNLDALLTIHDTSDNKEIFLNENKDTEKKFDEGKDIDLLETEGDISGENNIDAEGDLLSGEIMIGGETKELNKLIDGWKETAEALYIDNIPDNIKNKGIYKTKTEGTFDISKYVQDLVGTKIDGVVGRDTITKMAKFQKDNGLEQTGIINQKTLDKLIVDEVSFNETQETPSSEQEVTPEQEQVEQSSEETETNENDEPGDLGRFYYNGGIECFDLDNSITDLTYTGYNGETTGLTGSNLSLSANNLHDDGNGGNHFANKVQIKDDGDIMGYLIVGEGKEKGNDSGVLNKLKNIDSNNINDVLVGLEDSGQEAWLVGFDYNEKDKKFDNSKVHIREVGDKKAHEMIQVNCIDRGLTKDSPVNLFKEGDNYEYNKYVKISPQELLTNIDGQNSEIDSNTILDPDPDKIDLFFEGQEELFINFDGLKDGKDVLVKFSKTDEGKLKIENLGETDDNSSQDILTQNSFMKEYKNDGDITEISTVDINGYGSLRMKIKAEAYEEDKCDITIENGKNDIILKEIEFKNDNYDVLISNVVKNMNKVTYLFNKNGLNSSNVKDGVSKINGVKINGLNYEINFENLSSFPEEDGFDTFLNSNRGNDDRLSKIPKFDDNTSDIAQEKENSQEQEKVNINPIEVSNENFDLSEYMDSVAFVQIGGDIMVVNKAFDESFDDLKSGEIVNLTDKPGILRNEIANGAEDLSIEKVFDQIMKSEDIYGYDKKMSDSLMLSILNNMENLKEKVPDGLTIKPELKIPSNTTVEDNQKGINKELKSYLANDLDFRDNSDVLDNFVNDFNALDNFGDNNILEIGDYKIGKVEYYDDGLMKIPANCDMYVVKNDGIKMIPFKDIKNKISSTEIITKNLIDTESKQNSDGKYENKLDNAKEFDNQYYQEYFDEYNLDIKLNENNDITKIKVKDLDKVLDLLTIIGSNKELIAKVGDQNLESFDNNKAEKFIKDNFDKLDYSSLGDSIKSIEYKDGNYHIEPNNKGFTLGENSRIDGFKEKIIFDRSGNILNKKGETILTYGSEVNEFICSLLDNKDGLTKIYENIVAQKNENLEGDDKITFENNKISYSGQEIFISEKKPTESFSKFIDNFVFDETDNDTKADELVATYNEGNTNANLNYDKETNKFSKGDKEKERKDVIGNDDELNMDDITSMLDEWNSEDV